MSVDELKAKIAADIQKSGFGSEMKALRIIKDAGWSATGSVHYVDLDTGISRESDIEAHTVLSDASPDERTIYAQSFLSLSIEVKKTERPWIVFKEIPEHAFQLWEGRRSMAFVAGLKRQFRHGINHTVGETGLPQRQGWYGNGLHEAFKSPDQPSRWFSAFSSVCKAAEYELEQNSWDVPKDKDDDHFPYLWLSKPVVVLDGLLFSADLDDGDELALIEEKFCSVKFVHTSEKYRRGQYFVDVVTLSALEEYLGLMSERNDRLFEALKKLAAHGRAPPMPHG